MEKAAKTGDVAKLAALTHDFQRIAEEEAGVAARFVALADGGEEVIGDKPLGRHSVVSRRALPLQVVGAEMALGDKAPPGNYAADVSVVDVASGRSARRD